MKLPNFKDFLIIGIVTSLYSYLEEKDVNLKLYKGDFSFEIAPHNHYEMDDEQRKQYSEYHKIISQMNHKEPNITSDLFLNYPLSFVLKLNPSSLSADGVSFSQLKLLSEKFYTENIYVDGDGHDYQLSEMTSDHDRELTIKIVPENKQLLLKLHALWLENKETNKKIQKNKA